MLIDLLQSDDTFNITAATQAAVLNAPESTAPAQVTGSTTAILSPTSTPSSSSKAGPIAGGVVGGVVGLALIAALIFWWTRRRRSRTAPSAEVNYAGVAPTSPPPMSYNTSVSPSSYPVALMASPRLYDPSDPSTYPTPAVAPSTNYTGSSQVLLPNTTGSTYPESAVPGGRYTGAPEL
ncbi:hypothetical protein H0H87_002880 [Tephrocybe sp. NHM501043]|nr:hypothetical protein H0H87_002880 [Tephrocybe sp. NHM501043]